jgi:hypothetical protein
MKGRWGRGLASVAVLCAVAGVSSCTSSRSHPIATVRSPALTPALTPAVTSPAVVTSPARPATTGSTLGDTAFAPAGSAPAARKAPVFAFYYLWWDRQHWLSHLGSHYPAMSRPDPLPATVDAAGCQSRSLFAGNVETDVSQALAYDQSTRQTVNDDVRLAAKTGLAGFLVNWVGTGQAHQAADSSSYNTRLGYVFDAVHAAREQGARFSVILNYQSSAQHRSTSQIINDFAYFLSAYGKDSALDHTYSPSPEVLMAGTWKYADSDLALISQTFHSQVMLIGDEKPASWDSARDRYLDGTSYYWSSENPVKNLSAPRTLQNFAATVRRVPGPTGRPKVWLAPFSPGYNAMLLYHTPTCVPRDDGRTMKALFAANAASHPDGWTLISWNEITEGTYIVPLTRYGSQYTDELRSMLTN